MLLEEMIDEISGAAVQKRAVTDLGVLNEAYDYNRPSSFSRGMRIDLNGLVVLLISGTASIDENGETVHVGDFRAQCRRMFYNITGLLEAEGDVVEKAAAMRAHVLQHHRPAGSGGRCCRTCAGIARACSTTSPACWKRRAPLGTTSCALPSTCAISTATIASSTKSARRSTRSRGWTRCRPRRVFRRSCAVRSCWWKAKPSPSSAAPLPSHDRKGVVHAHASISILSCRSSPDRKSTR